MKELKEKLESGAVLGVGLSTASDGEDLLISRPTWNSVSLKDLLDVCGEEYYFHVVDNRVIRIMKK